MINTTRFGQIDETKYQRITFPEGLVGFPEFQNYRMIPHDKNEAIHWMQNEEDGAICFVVAPAKAIRPDYEAEVTIDQVPHCDDHETTEVLAVLCVGANRVTANLKAPLVVNTRTREAKQVILKDGKYNTREPVN